ncbi:MFS transporter [Halomicrococcus sp. NG-SE-24]|uniref:MFS transporter n=1 Tax=Halomicrococcus sp. NG-SE-24 TaxID=3436928 RepID=UPI003D97650F
MTTVPEDMSPQSATVPWRSTTVQVVLASTFLAPLGVPLISPALPVVRDQFGITDATASLLISVYFLTGIVLSPLIGMLADRVGRRRVLVVSLFTFSLSGGALAFVGSFDLLLVIRLVQGTAAAGIFIATVTLIGDAFSGVQRNAVLGVNNAMLSAGAAAYPLVGGALVAVAWNAPFLAYFAGLPVAAFAFLTLEEPVTDREPRRLVYIRNALTTLSGRSTAVYYGSAFATEVLLFGSVLTALPFLLTAQYDLSPVGIGLVVTAAEVVSIVVSSQNGRLARSLSNRLLVAGGFASFGIGLVGTWLAPTALFVGVAVTFVGAGLGLSMPSVDAAISGLVSDRYRAGALSIRNSTTFLGRSLGPVLFAGLALTTGYRPLLLGAGLVAFAWSLVVLLATR